MVTPSTWGNSLVAALCAEIMAIADAPSNPMTMILRVRFKDGVPLEFRAALTDAFRRLDVLRRQCVFTEHGCDWPESTLTPEQLADRALARDGDYIDVTQAPLFRLRRDGRWVTLIAHHALADGRGAIALLFEIWRQWGGDWMEKRRPATAKEGETPRPTPARLLELGRRLTRPAPRMLGPLDPRVTGKHLFVTRDLAPRDYQHVRGAIVRRKASVNDAVMAALHMALAKLPPADNEAGHEDNIDVMMPVDLRFGERLPGQIANCSSSVHVRSTSWERRDRETLLRHIVKRTTDTRQKQLGYALADWLLMHHKLGTLGIARRTRMKHGLPPRLVNPKKGYWRSLHTAVLSNLGTLRFPPEFEAVTHEVQGFPPLLPPTRLGIDVAVSKRGLHLWLHTDTLTFSEQSAGALLDSVIQELIAFA